MKNAPDLSFIQRDKGKSLPLALGNNCTPTKNHSWPLTRLTLLIVAGINACSIVPTPLTIKELADTVNTDKKMVLDGQEPIDHPIDIYEAMARALKYNLDYRVQLLEKTVALADVDLSDYALLPKLAANAGFTSRNSEDASSGFSLTTQKPSNAYSTASDLTKTTADLNMVWNVLDFGVSYFQAKQTADRLLVAEENRRKLVHTQLQEVQSAFWYAISSQELQGEIEPILQQANQALEDAYLVERQGLRPQLEMMRYQRALLDIVRKLEALREELEMAKKNLAKLINHPPSLPLLLKTPNREAFEVIPIQITSEEMEQLALQNRPEMRKAMYDNRISVAETRKAMLRLLPGLEFNSALHYDSNSFALNSTWETAGLQVTSNLLNLVSGPATLRLAKNQEALSHMRRLAMSMAILSQVHIAARKYLDSKRKFETAKQINAIDQRVLTNISVATNLKTQNRLDHIQAATRGIMSRLQHNKAFAETQNAIGMMSVSLGVDFLPTIQPNDSLATLSQSLRNAVEAWNDAISSSPTENTPFKAAEAWNDAISASPIENMPFKAVEAWNDAISAAPTENTLLIEKLLMQAFLQDEKVAKKTDQPTLNPDTTVDEQPTSAAASLVNYQQQATKQPLTTDSNQQLVGTQALLAQTATTDEHPPYPEQAITAEPSQQNTALEPQQTITHEPSQQNTALEPQQAVTHEPSQQTTVVDQQQTPTSDPNQQINQVEEVRNVVKKWVKAWSRHRIKPFFALYSPAFSPAGKWTKQQWLISYENFIQASNSTKIALTDLAVELQTNMQAKAFVYLEFETNKQIQQKQKTLTLSKEATGWHIVGEQAGIQFEQTSRDKIQTVSNPPPPPRGESEKKI